MEKDKTQENFKKMQPILLHISNYMEHLQMYNIALLYTYTTIKYTECILYYYQAYSSRKMVIPLLWKIYFHPFQS